MLPSWGEKEGSFALEALSDPAGTALPLADCDLWPLPSINCNCGHSRSHERCESF